MKRILRSRSLLTQKHSIVSRTLGLSLGVMATACVSVPKGAPEEFHAAQEAISAADRMDADTYMPKTMARAEKTLAEAVGVFEKAIEDGTESSMSHAREKAQQAEVMAQNAIRVRDGVRSWDDDITPFLVMEESERELLFVREQAATMQEDDPLQRFEMSSPVAYFDTGEAETVSGSDAKVRELAALLKNNPQLQVAITGYADGRGSQSYNQELSKMRAEKIASMLEDEGIERDRVTVSYAGESQTQAGGELNAGQLQLDRRVEAKISALAH